jgi:NADPH-dependent 2,4-dienoyl-CoA reductase/sulfur reductase-like enzyme
VSQAYGAIVPGKIACFLPGRVAAITRAGASRQLTSAPGAGPHGGRFAGARRLASTGDEKQARRRPMRHTTGDGNALPAPPGSNEHKRRPAEPDRHHGQRLPLGAVMSGGRLRRPRRPGAGPAAGARARVVIVGAGFGGLECARGLDRATADVLLLDRGGYHLFTPLLYQVATALLNPSEIAYPLRAMFRKSPNVRVRATTVTGVDLSRRVVRAAPGAEIPYDYLVLASGSASDYHGNQQLADNSIGLKTLEDGTRLRNHVLGCLERADQETDPAERRALLTFVVAGGGPGGVERRHPPENAHHAGRRPSGDALRRQRGSRADPRVGRRRRPAGPERAARAGHRPWRADPGG